MSFYCDHCHFSNNEIQPASEVQEQGTKHTFKITHVDDLQRQVIKSETAIFRVEDLEIEVPAGRGRLTNIEGILSDVLSDLEAPQRQRKKDDPELYTKIDGVVKDLIKLTNGGKLPFVISIDDPAGNSSIEPSPHDAALGGKYLSKHYPRTPAQNTEIGLGQTNDGLDDDQRNLEEGEVTHRKEVNGQNDPHDHQITGEVLEDVDILEGQVYNLPVECPGCTKPAHIYLQMVNIPYFKQVVLSTTRCDHCNFHTTDVKTGGEVPEKGKRIYLDVKGTEDLKRDILKSETCLLRVPECEVEVAPGTMGGRFTTVEGLLTQVRDDLRGSIFDAGDEKSLSDSMPTEKKKAWDVFFAKLDQALDGKVQYTIIMEDPLASSYCQQFPEPGKDPNVRTEEYERTEEEEDALGLKDMKTHRNANGEYVKEPDGLLEIEDAKEDAAKA